MNATKSSWRAVAGRAEGPLLAFVAGYIVWLLTSGNYWQMLNPRFQWLTGAAAGGLFLCAGVLAFRPARGNLPRLGILTVFCLLLAVTLWGPEGMALPKTTIEAERASPFEIEVPEPLPKLELAGREYTRISTPELLNLVEKTPQEVLAGEWALRGVVERTPELDAMGSFALLRPFIWCCLADGVAVGFLVPYADVESLETGQWVRVAGRIERADLAAGAKNVTLGSFFVALDGQHVFRPTEETGEAVQVIETPTMPFVFTVRESPPFSW